MMWQRIIWLFILFLLGRHLGYPSSPRYLELADSTDFFIAHENWDRAEKSIIEALRLEPANFSNSMLLANLGLVQTHKGEFKKAIQSLTLGLNIAPSSTVLLNNRAHTYLLMDSTLQAINDIDKSLSIDSVQEWTLMTRGFLYLNSKNADKAKMIFEKMQKLFPENPSVFSGLAAVAEFEGNDNSAIDMYRKTIALDTNNDEAREALIAILIRNNQYTEARAELREALRINPENPMFYLLRGYLHRLNYRYDEAIADKKIALSKGADATLASGYIP